MYTILIQDDNTLHTSVKTQIMQGSKNVDQLHFLANPVYNEMDMTDLNVILTYILPVSKERKTIALTKSEELYKNKLEYKIILDDDVNFITSEVGDIKMWITFKNDSGVIRYTTPIILTIYPTADSEVDDADPIQAPPVVNNIYLDTDSNELYLTSSDGTAVGAKIPLNDLSNAIVDTSNDGLVTVITE